MENEKDTVEEVVEDTVEETTEEEVVTEEVAEEADPKDKEIKELQDKLAESQKTSRQRKRALNKQEKTDTPSDLSNMDMLSIIDSKVPKEDVEEVLKASKLLGKSVSETLDDPMVQNILKTRLEYRATAEASNVDSARPSSSKITDAEIVEKANKGEIPAKGTPEAEQLYHARRRRG